MRRTLIAFLATSFAYLGAAAPLAAVAEAPALTEDERAEGEVAGLPAGEARARLEEFVDGLEGLRARFTQTTSGPDGMAREMTEGEVWLQVPRQLRWETEGDFPERIVADGERVWVYDEALDQVTVKPQPQDASGTPLVLLADLSALDRQYRSVEVGNIEDVYLLSLRARDAEAEFESILIGVADDGVRLMVLEDAFGQRTEIRFGEVQRNPPMAGELFTFTPPPGADVVGEADLLDLPRPQD